MHVGEGTQDKHDGQSFPHLPSGVQERQRQRTARPVKQLRDLSPVLSSAPWREEGASLARTQHSICGDVSNNTKADPATVCFFLFFFKGLMFVLRDTFERVGLDFGFLQALLSLQRMGWGGRASKRLIICFLKSEMLVSGLWLFAEPRADSPALSVVRLRLCDKQHLEAGCAGDGL